MKRTTTLPYTKIYQHLVEAYGYRGAQLIQKINSYIQSGCGLEHDGRRWISNTQEEWAKQLKVSVRTAKRVVSKLRDLGVLLFERLGRCKWDRTLFVTLNLPIVDGVARLPHAAISVDTDMLSNSSFSEENGGKLHSAILALSMVTEHAESGTITDSPANPQDSSLSGSEMAENCIVPFWHDGRGHFGTMEEAILAPSLKETKILTETRARPQAERDASHTFLPKTPCEELALSALGRAQSLDGLSGKHQEEAVPVDPLIVLFIASFRAQFGDWAYATWLVPLRLCIGSHEGVSEMTFGSDGINAFHRDTFLTRYGAFVNDFCRSNGLKW